MPWRICLQLVSQSGGLARTCTRGGLPDGPKLAEKIEQLFGSNVVAISHTLSASCRPRSSSNIQRLSAGGNDILEVLDKEDSGRESHVSKIARTQDDDATRGMEVEDTSEHTTTEETQG